MENKKKINYTLKPILVLITLVLVLNCASSSAGIATSNIPIVNKKYKVISPVEESEWWLTFDIAIMGVPFRKPPINELMKKMIDEKKADALVNIRWWMDRSVFLFITRSRLGISAEAVKFEEEVPVEKKKR